MDFSLYEAVFLDLDGTIYQEDRVLDGAPELVARLQRENRRYACLSNSTASPRQISLRLQRMGIRIDPEHIFPATEAAADYVLEKYGARPKVMNLATAGMQEMLDGKVDWVNAETDACDAVLAGCPTNEYATEDRQRVALVLLKRGAELIGICADRVFPSPRGLEFGTGAMCALLGYAANVKPTFCGKPERTFFLELCHKLRVDPGRCILIGDNPESDIAGAKPLGMKTVLTLTGITTRDDIQRLPDHLQPDWIIDGLRDL